jgi:hypothetical protein
VPNILIRDIPEETLERLKKLAKNHNRSLQQELKDIIVNWSKQFSIDISKRASKIRGHLRSKKITFSDSAKLIREDRDR